MSLPCPWDNEPTPRTDKVLDKPFKNYPEFLDELRTHARSLEKRLRAAEGLLKEMTGRYVEAIQEAGLDVIPTYWQIVARSEDYLQAAKW